MYLQGVANGCAFYIECRGIMSTIRTINYYREALDSWYIKNSAFTIDFD